MLAFISIALAADGGQPAGSEGIFWSLLPIILIVPIFYFLVILPQQKTRRKHQTMLQNLKKGDRVVCTSGIIGTVVSMDKDTIVLQVAPDVKLRMLKTAVSEVMKESSQKK